MERRAVRSCFYAQPGRIFVMWREFWLALQKSTFLENTRYAPASAPSSDEPGYASNARDSFLSAVGGRRSRVSRVHALRQWCLPAELLDGEAEKTLSTSLPISLPSCVLSSPIPFTPIASLCGGWREHYQHLFAKLVGWWLTVAHLTFRCDSCIRAARTGCSVAVTAGWVGGLRRMRRG